MVIEAKNSGRVVKLSEHSKLKNNNQTEFEFSTLLHDLDEINPVLDWLYQPTTPQKNGKNTVKFTQAIQPIFYPHSIITTGTNQTLSDTIDYVYLGINSEP